MTKNVLIIAGEASGDLHAANLIRNLKSLNPNLHFFGIGGEKMEKEGVDLIYRMEKLSIIGVSEIFSKFKYIHTAYKKIIDKVRESRPNIVILIDYPGFNLTLAKSLNKKDFPVVYYITPQVWAWGRFRIRSIKKYIDKAVVIFKFEEELFKRYGIDATFVGHPLLDHIKSDNRDVARDRESCGLEGNKMTMALLPGSRESEVTKMLPVMLKTAEIILKQKNIQFTLLKTSGINDGVYERILETSKLRIAAIKDDSQKCLSISDFAFVSSGTATLESAIMEKPMVIIYKTSLLTAILFKVFSRTPFIGLVNIIAGKKIVPEILQYDARPLKLATEILSIISSEEKLKNQIQSLRWVKSSLGTPGASLRAARIIENFIT